MEVLCMLLHEETDSHHGSSQPSCLQRAEAASYSAHGKFVSGRTQSARISRNWTVYGFRQSQGPIFSTQSSPYRPISASHTPLPLTTTTRRTDGRTDGRTR